MTKTTPDAIEALRQLHARDPYDAAFIAAILELGERLNALAKVAAGLHRGQGTLNELYRVMSDELGALAFLSAMSDKRTGADADADADEQVM
jgi:hypothetical protein